MTLFSKIIAKQIPCYLIEENNLFIAFLDIFPLQYGHTLVVPKIEVDKIFDLPATYLSHLLLFAQPIAKAIEKAYPCNRVNIVTVGLEVPHAHLHLVPINHSTDMNVDNEKLPLSAAELTAVQENIKKHL
jgi:histidine triad (HIT) family protein